MEMSLAQEDAELMVGKDNISMTKNNNDMSDEDIAMNDIDNDDSVVDARIFNQALRRRDLNFPHPLSGKYYLVGSGYPTMIGYLGPYKGERYHLPDFRRNSNFRNSNETFNIFHSSLRCTIERIFGVWKDKFALQRSMPSFKFATQISKKKMGGFRDTFRNTKQIVYYYENIV
ncbi:hypothetical protein KY285_036733 [Solanum tuberosum]|nr:hypothetical protein KY289_036934 [Solanum tuberosum]KAH0640147.1 hypothetical protein KY285_036733 [Solanum tuberosum]